MMLFFLVFCKWLESIPLYILVLEFAESKFSFCFSTKILRFHSILMPFEMKMEIGAHQTHIVNAQCAFKQYVNSKTNTNCIGNHWLELDEVLCIWELKKRRIGHWHALHGHQINRLNAFTHEQTFERFHTHGTPSTARHRENECSLCYRIQAVPRIYWEKNELLPSDGGA